jgi:hypothetical protein
VNADFHIEKGDLIMGAPSELCQQVFGDVSPREFWEKSHAKGCQQADEAVVLALAGMPPFFLDVPSLPEDGPEILSRYLAAYVPGVPHDASDKLTLPGW